MNMKVFLPFLTFATGQAYFTIRNLTYNIVRENIDSARSHLGQPDALTLGLLNVLESLAEDAIFVKNVDISSAASSILMSRSSAQPRASAFFNVENIRNYGCFCRFGSTWRKSHGQPVNDIDEACRSLYHCYKCAGIDSLNDGGEVCDPSETEYTVPMVKDIDEHGTYAACSEINTMDPCQIRTCCCDINFAKNILQFFFDQNMFDPAPSHENGFLVDEECPVCQGTGCSQGPKDCCGEYPERFPYSMRDGSRGCCVNKTYNVNRLFCCDNMYLKKSCP